MDVMNTQTAPGMLAASASQLRLLAPLVLAVVPMFAGSTLGCSTMTSSVQIHAPPARVWSIVADVDHYGDWNPFFVKGHGELAVGASLDLEMAPVDASKQAFSPTVLAVTPERELVWRGRVLVPGVFDGTHHFVLTPTASGGTLFTQREDFSGVLVPFVSFGPYHAGWDRMNQALKARAEAASGR